MTNASGIEAYQQGHTQVQAAGASDIQKVLMLINGFLDELERLRGHIESENAERNIKSVIKMMGILDGLDVALDMQNGGKLAQDIHDLYTDVGARILKANEDGSLEDLDVARKVMTELKEGWEGIEKNLQ